MTRKTWEIITTECKHTISVPVEPGKGWECMVEALWACRIRTKEDVKNVKHIYSIYGLNQRGEYVNWQKMYLEEIKKRGLTNNPIHGIINTSKDERK